MAPRGARNGGDLMEKGLVGVSGMLFDEDVIS
jgi:hypothetical protein